MPTERVDYEQTGPLLPQEFVRRADPEDEPELISDYCDLEDKMRQLNGSESSSDSEYEDEEESSDLPSEMEEALEFQALKEEELRSNLNKVEAECEEYEAKNLELIVKIAELQQESEADADQELQEEYENLIRELEEAKERCKEGEKQLEQQEETIKIEEEELQSILKQLEDGEEGEERKKLEEEVSLLETQIAAIKNQAYEADQVKRQVDAQRSVLEKFTKLTEASDLELKEKQREMEQLQEQLRQITQQIHQVIERKKQEQKGENSIFIESNSSSDSETFPSHQSSQPSSDSVSSDFYYSIRDRSQIKRQLEDQLQNYYIERADIIDSYGSIESQSKSLASKRKRQALELELKIIDECIHEAQRKLTRLSNFTTQCNMQPIKTVFNSKLPIFKMVDIATAICAKCGRRPDELLILSCEHNICLLCAAKNMKREQQRHALQTVVCDICGAATVLDPSSATELIKIAPEESLRETDQNWDNWSPEKENAFTPDRMDRNSQECLEHPDETVSYFCFDCMGRCICAECVVHGSHRNHEVLNIRKTLPQIQARLEDLVIFLSGKLDNLEMHASKLSNRKKEIAEQGQSARQQMLHVFDDIRQRIDKKEKELLDGADRLLEDYIKEIEAHNKMLVAQSYSIKQKADQVQSIMESADAVTVLNFYAENNDAVYNMSEADISAVGEKGVNFKCQIDTSVVIDQVDQLRGLPLEVSGYVEQEEYSSRGKMSRKR